jgi:peptide/nickel transport system ATP-binding protein
MNSPDEEAIVVVRDLTVALRRGHDGRSVHAVNGVSFAVSRGRTLGIVGESGCGKSTTSLAIPGLLPRTAKVAGSVRFAGQELLTLAEPELRALRGRRVAMIFQDPMVALDPLFTVGDQLAEPLRLHMGLEGDALHARQVELLEAVGIPSPERRLGQYPHELSGGQLQRLITAMAIACDPDLLIADEPTTALDPTAQASILELLERLGEQLGLALVIVTHDLGVVARICDDVMVMYAGSAVEQGPVRAIFDHPRHPYTKALLASLPHIDDDGGWLHVIEGQPPDLTCLPPGCPFAPRCAMALPACAEPPPPVTFDDGHVALCWRAEEL